MIGNEGKTNHRNEYKPNSEYNAEVSTPQSAISENFKMTRQVSIPIKNFASENRIIYIPRYHCLNPPIYKTKMVDDLLESKLEFGGTKYLIITDSPEPEKINNIYPNPNSEIRNITLNGIMLPRFLSDEIAKTIDTPNRSYNVHHRIDDFRLRNLLRIGFEFNAQIRKDLAKLRMKYDEAFQTMTKQEQELEALHKWRKTIRHALFWNQDPEEVDLKIALTKRLYGGNVKSWLLILKALEDNFPSGYKTHIQNNIPPDEKELIDEVIKNSNQIKEMFDGAPKNENQLRKIFDRYSYLFGIRVLHAQTEHPDYLLLMGGREIRAEAELHSNTYLQHKHDKAKCDMVICWEHNLPVSKLELDVFEMATGRLFSRDGSVRQIEPRNPASP